jgi:hypothetical protein
MSLATLNEISLITDARSRIANISNCTQTEILSSLILHYVAVFNLTTAIGAYSKLNYFVWPTRNKTLNWAPNHPLSGNLCSYLSMTDDFIYSANCSVGPVLALCDSRYLKTKHYSPLVLAVFLSQEATGLCEFDLG